MKPRQIRFVESFGGISAARSALNLLLGDYGYSVQDYCEISQQVVEAYNIIYGEPWPTSDIRTWTPKQYGGRTDIYVHGSPCQDFSINGVQRGGEEGSGTHSSLLFESLKCLKERFSELPYFVIWENVLGAKSKRNIGTYNKYLSEMAKIGYFNYELVLDAQDFALPQMRKRIFVVSALCKQGGDPLFDFDPGRVNNDAMRKITLRAIVDSKSPSGEHGILLLKKRRATEVYEKNFERLHPYGLQFQKDHLLKQNIHDLTDYIPTFNQESRATGLDCPAIYCVSSQGTHSQSRVFDFVDNKVVIRGLGGRENMLLMGFSEQQYNEISSHFADSTISGFAGNSIAVSVIFAIFREIVRSIREKENAEQSTGAGVATV